VYTAPNFSSRKRQSIARASFASSWFKSTIWSSRARNKSCPPLSRRSRGRIEPSAPEPQEQGIRAFDSRESLISILQGNRPKHPETRQNPAPQFAKMSTPITVFLRFFTVD
jgi:hypothetical protein